MVTLFANTFKAPYYEHLMGSSSQHFYEAVRIAERIEQGIKAGRIAEPLETKGFIGRKMEGHVNNFEGGSKGKIMDSHNPQIPTSHVAHINFNKPFSSKTSKLPVKQPKQLPKIKHKIHFITTTAITHAFEGHVCQTTRHLTNSSYPHITTITTIPHLVQARVDLRVLCWYSRAWF
jgi:hypothetical protein